MEDVSPEHQALISRGIAPIKPQYIRKPGSRSPLEALQGVKAADEAAAKQQEQPLQKKSKRQLKKERQEQKLKVCNSFINTGVCQYGDKCRFKHDLEAYLSSKPRDLPGRCPFSSQATCPYGLACRWASTHSDAAAANGGASTTSAALPSTSQPGSSAAAAASGPTLEGNVEATAAPPSSSALSPANALPSNTAALAPQAGAVAGQDGQQSVAATHTGTTGVSEGGRPVVDDDGGVLSVASGDGSIPRGMQELPVAEEVAAPINNLDRELRNQLWKQTYDFSRSDEVMDRLGLRISRRQQQRQAPEGNGQLPAKRSKLDPSASADPSDGSTLATNGTAKGGPSAADDAMELDNVGPETAGIPERPSDRAIESEPASLGDDSASDASAAGTSSDQAPPAGAAPAAAASAGDVLHAVPGLAAHQEPSATAEDLQPVPIYDVRREHAEAGSAADGVVSAGQNGDPMAVDGGDGGGDDVPLRREERRPLDLRGKLYLAPLTTVGNLPFRRLCVGLGADVTCGEMAVATNLLQGQASEWALLKRHPDEKLFGVQIAGGYSDAMARVAQLIEEHVEVDFVDINCGCPIDLICNKGAGSSLLLKSNRMRDIVQSMSQVLTCPLTIKIRKGYYDGQDVAHSLLPRVAAWGAAAATLHGRTRQQRYSRQADWEYINRCAAAAPELPLIGNGDVMSYTDFHRHLEAGPPNLTTLMIARGALMKPWCFTEIKERRHWDISAGERLDLLRRYCSFGLQHWGSDARGVETTRRFLLEWLSFLHRYVPVGLLEVLPQQLHWRPPAFVGRNDLETLLASANPADWVRISELLLGPAPPSFQFAPKHKSNAYASSEMGMALDDGQENG